MDERNLHQFLSDCTKPQLEDIEDILGKPGNGYRSKAKLVDELDRYLRGEPRRWLSLLSERDLRQLRELVHAGPDKVMVQALSGYPSLVEVIGLVHTDDSEQDRHKVWIDREVYDIVRSDVDEVFRLAERSGQFELERMGLGYLNLYGAIETDRLLFLLSDWYRQTHPQGIRPSALVRSISRAPWFKLYRYEDERGDYLVSPCVSAPAELLDLRETMGVRPRSLDFSFDRVREAGSGAPYFTVGMKTPEGMRLEALYRRLGFEGFDVTLALHDTWVEAQYTEQRNDELLGPLLDSPRASQLDQESWEAACRIVADYADSVPKWFLCGASAREAGKGLADWEGWGEGEAEETPGEDMPRPWTLPEPTISEGYAAEIFTENYPVGLAVPHVAPGDPCPCGSGLRYSRCHGRYLS